LTQILGQPCEFQALNASRWTVNHNGTHGALEQQLYVGSAATLDGAGHLVLTTARADPAARPTGPDGKSLYNFTSGWVETQGKLETAFGRWEIRARLPDPSARGIWPAHWLMPRFQRGSATAWNCWPVGGEIDIMEATGGVYNNTVLGTYHWGANCSGPPPPPPTPPVDPSSCTCGCGCDLHRLSNMNGKFECTHPEGDPWHCEKAHDFSKGFHVFAVEWEPTAIRWYVDAALYWTRTLGVDNVSFIPSQPLYIILNTAIQPAIWNKGAGEEGSYPVEHTVDYVRVWERPKGVRGPSPRSDDGGHQ
jgi:beta-glucanase (GH16 family)